MDPTEIMQPLIVIVCQDQTIRYKTLPFQSRLKRLLQYALRQKGMLIVQSLLAILFPPSLHQL